MIKNLSTFFIGIALSCLAGCTPIPKETTATKEYAPLEVPVPERPAGQQDVIELTTPKLDTVRVGFIGLGMRGPSAVDVGRTYRELKLSLFATYCLKMRKKHKKL